ncbi:MAG: HipA domain-containing protein [Candidatus Symbiothrix sp.]|jgi:serine/threonine-protein kinase HipA|nr:HipA domain-containing protein [Candidatus Symbiothrix sp.]
MSKCLFCYKELKQEQIDFHPACSRKIFGTEIAPILPYTRAQISELAEQVIRNQTTVTGVQPKLSLDLGGEKNIKHFTIVGLWGKYILKPQTEYYSQLPENEDLTMHLAEITGIKTVPHSLIRFADGELCYITKRIDRDNTGNKIPMEDMCQLTERLTEYKYKGSYEQIAKIILKYSVTPLLDLANFWEEILFSWLTGNADMHLKNFSLYSPVKGQTILAPAYDLLSTALVMPEDKEESALALTGKKSRLKRSDFEKAFEQSGLNKKVIDNTFAKLKKTVPQWFDFIENSFLHKENKDKYQDIIHEKLEKIKL